MKFVNTRVPEHTFEARGYTPETQVFNASAKVNPTNVMVFRSENTVDLYRATEGGELTNGGFGLLFCKEAR